VPTRDDKFGASIDIELLVPLIVILLPPTNASVGDMIGADVPAVLPSRMIDCIKLLARADISTITSEPKSTAALPFDELVGPRVRVVTVSPIVPCPTSHPAKPFEE
jgi:hypothetical protein